VLYCLGNSLVVLFDLEMLDHWLFGNSNLTGLLAVAEFQEIWCYNSKSLENVGFFLSTMLIKLNVQNEGKCHR
jgi:hypothetical protein